VHDNTLFVAVHSPKSHHKSITFSVTVQLCDKMLFFLNVDRTASGNTETMSLEVTVNLQYII
jgi:hypothetical protein